MPVSLYNITYTFTFNSVKMEFSNSIIFHKGIFLVLNNGSFVITVSQYQQFIYLGFYIAFNTVHVIS